MQRQTRQECGFCIRAPFARTPVEPRSHPETLQSRREVIPPRVLLRFRCLTWKHLAFVNHASHILGTFTGAHPRSESPSMFMTPDAHFGASYISRTSYWRLTSSFEWAVYQLCVSKWAATTGICIRPLKENGDISQNLRPPLPPSFCRPSGTWLKVNFIWSTDILCLVRHRELPRSRMCRERRFCSALFCAELRRTWYCLSNLFRVRCRKSEVISSMRSGRQFRDPPERT